MPKEINPRGINDNNSSNPKEGDSNFGNQDIFRGDADSLPQPKNKIKKFEFFKKSINTMQDDMANLISKKNHKKGRSGEEESTRKEVQRNLADVYTDGDGKIPDLTRLEKMQRPLWKTILYSLIAILVVLLGVGLAGFYFFSSMNNDTFTNEKVTLKIQSPLTIVSGQETPYTITITNKEKISLYNVKLELFYPDDFTFISSDPEASGDKKNSWEFSSLKEGEKQQITVNGKIVAALNSPHTIKGMLSFKPANLNAVFRQEAIIDMIISSSTVGLEITGPDKTLANQQNEYVIKYKNNGPDDLTDLQLLLRYPDGFVFASAEPSPQVDNNSLWPIATLKAGEEGEVKIKGDYSAIKDGGNKEFKAQIQLKKDNVFLLQSEQVLITDVIKDQLSLQLIINGSSEDQPINFGDLLVYSLNYKNTGQDELKNIKISAKINSQILNGDSLNDSQKGTVNQNTITWTGQQVPKLLKLGPGEEGEITWSVRVKEADIINDKNVNSFSVESFIEAVADQSGVLSGQSIVKSKTITNSINSDLNLEAWAGYYNEDNIAMGSGPIEPKVGEKSSYNITISLANNLHDVNNVVVVATLPQGVIWDNKEDHNTGNVNFNSQTRKLTWTISRLPKSANGAVTSFSVGIKPAESDFGKTLVLVSDVNLTAKDGNTGSDISKSLKAITTTFNDPIVGQVSGVVK